MAYEGVALADSRKLAGRLPRTRARAPADQKNRLQILWVMVELLCPAAKPGKHPLAVRPGG